MTTIVKFVRADGSVGYGQVNENPKKHYARQAYRHARHGAMAVRQHPYLAAGVGLVLGGLAGYAIGVNKSPTVAPAYSTGNFFRSTSASTFSAMAAFNPNATRNRMAAYRFPAMVSTDGNEILFEDNLFARRTMDYGLSVADNVPQSAITRGRGTPFRPV